MSVHLADFVDQFQSYFRHGKLAHSHRPIKCDKLYRDSYRGPLIEIGEEPFPLLLCIDVTDSDARVRALLHLIDRTLPKIWPEIYSDLLDVRRVAELQSRRNGVIATLRSEVSAIDGQIAEELAFYAPYTAMVLTGDDALKELVKDALDDVFGFDVVDLDDETPEREQKTLDLWLSHGGDTWLCEVRSRGNGNLRETDLDRFERNYTRAHERHGDAGHKLLVFNGMYRQSSTERSDSPPFGSKRVVEEAEDRGIGLVSVQQLLEAIQMVRNGDLSVDELANRLRGAGVVDLPGLST